MAESPSPNIGLDETTVEAFAVHLEEFANTLSDRERVILSRFLTSVLDPWDRMRLRDPADLLSTSEAEILRALENERQK